MKKGHARSARTTLILHFENSKALGFRLFLDSSFANGGCTVAELAAALATALAKLRVASSAPVG
jgi:hypothetical protein